MMLESLFAHAAQEQTFLAMMACGLALGGALQCSGALRRRWKALGFLWDGLFALLALVLALMVMLRFGSGLRAYALLGVTLGMLLYHAGVSRAISAAARLMGRFFQKWGKSAVPKEGEARRDDEFIPSQTSGTGDEAEAMPPPRARVPRKHRRA